MITVIMNDTGEHETYETGYGERLIEQGKATIAPKDRPVKTSRKKPEAVTEDEPENADRS